MKNKKTIMSVSAILILIFHLWINISNCSTEVFLRQLCVVGVDLFFFTSIYGISKKKELNYKKFIENRFVNVYLKFIILTIIMGIISSWHIDKSLLTLFGIDLFISGGGSFLWFLPGIMIIYILLPIYKKADTTKPLLTMILTVLFFLISIISISLLTNYKAIFILINRIPIMLIAYYIGKYDIIEKLEKNKILYWTTTLVLLIIGLIISYNTIINKFTVNWLYDIFYILNIPFELGLILLLNRIKENKITNIIGGCTLELYGLQMMFGFKIVNRLYLKINNPLITNLCMIIIFVLMAIVLKYIFECILKQFNKK